ncbi:MAG: hypothetical protein RL011_679, partial [Pseudomonadota bacterium]
RDVTFLVSDYFRGEELPRFVGRQPGGRLSPFEGLHLLHALALGVEQVHNIGEAHGDVAPDNVLVRRKGLSFQAKLIDLKPGLQTKAEDLAEDVDALLSIFQTIIGGNKAFITLPNAVRALCQSRRKGGLRFRHAADLRLHLENLTWT